ncbi:MAG: phage portal protein [Actinoplanes sp.]
MTSLLRSLAGRVIEGEIIDMRQSNKIPVPIVSQHPAFVDSLSGGHGDDGGDKEAQAGAMTANGTLFAIVGGISFDVSAVEWKLYRKAASGKTEDRTEVPPGMHPSQELFDQPNDFMPGQEFFEVVQQHMELTGEGWCLASWKMGMPFELWPVYPHRMVPIPDPTAFLQGYVYRSPDGQKIPLGLKEVTQLRQPHPLNLFRGLSAVQAISAELSAGRAANAWNDRFFRNSAVPGGIIEQDIEASGLSDDEFKRFTQRWREAHQGVQNAHRVAVLEQGMKWVPNAYSIKDLQLVELRGMSRDVVREAYRYPISKLGTVEDVNRANGEAQETRYARDILKPRLIRWRSWRNREIMPLFGGDWRSYEWDFEPPEPEDTEQEAALLTARSAAWQIFVNGGVDGKAAIDELGLPAGLGDAWTKPEPPPVAAPGGAGAVPGKKSAPPKNEWTTPAWADYPTAMNEAEFEDFKRRWHEAQGNAATWLPFNADDAPPGLDELGEQWQSAVDATVATWLAEVSPAQQDACAQAVQDAVDSGDPSALGALAVPVMGDDLLLAAMLDMVTAGITSVVTEAESFGASVARGVVDRTVLGEAAAATAGLLAQGLANAAGREALRLLPSNSLGGDIAAGVRAYLSKLTDRSLRDAIGGAMTRALNAGRLATYRLAMTSPIWRVVLRASEHHDGAACTPCKEIDGTVLPSIDAAQLAYGGAGYLFCEGGVRCRGTVIGVWERITDDGA